MEQFSNLDEKVREHEDSTATFKNQYGNVSKSDIDLNKNNVGGWEH